MTERLSLSVTFTCIKETASGKLLFGTGNSARSSVVTQRGGEGIYVYIQLIHFIVQERQTKYYNAITP